MVGEVLKGCSPNLRSYFKPLLRLLQLLEFLWLLSDFYGLVIPTNSCNKFIYNVEAGMYRKFYIRHKSVE